MAELSFGIGGYGGHQRRYMATVKGDLIKINLLQRGLNMFGFWTVVINKEIKHEQTEIEIGEVITQKVA